MIHNNILIKVLIVIMLFFTLSFSVKADTITEGKKIIVVFRFDDYSSRSSTDIEIKLIDAFQKYNACCTFAVIPYVCAGDINDTRPQDIVALTSVKADILINAIEAGVLEIALHGYSHQTIRERMYFGSTEFSGLDYNAQVKKIAKGKEYLEKILDTRITTFIPPWGGYDLNTIRALEKLDFKTISAGECSDATEVSTLKFLPATCDLLHLRNVIKSAKHDPDIQPVIIVLFHQYDFLEINREKGKFTYQDFLKLLAWVTSQKDIHIRTIDQTTNVIDDLSVSRYINYNSYRKLFHLIPPIPPSLSKLYFNGIYLSSNTAHNVKIKCWILILALYLTILMVSIIITFFAVSIVLPSGGFVTSIFKYGSIALLVFFSIYVLRDLELGYQGAMVIVVLLGASIGIWSSSLKTKNNII